MTVRNKRMAEWLLLTLTLPTKRASQRVEIWRKLQRYGTVPLGNSGYLLPNNLSNEERFQWLATAIRKYGGDASVVHVELIDNLSKAQLIGRFSEARTREYQVKELLERVASSQGARGTMPVRKVNAKDYKGRVWVTRPRPGVDRCSSAWLIRRFIDPKARFAFAPEGRVPTGSVPFDMFHEEGFGHRGDDCTFEILEKQFHIRDPRVAVIGQMIHDADLLDDRFGRKEGYGVDEILKGWARQGLADEKLLERGMELIEGLYHAPPK